jgi:hypothetical protein
VVVSDHFLQSNKIGRGAWVCQISNGNKSIKMNEDESVDRVEEGKGDGERNRDVGVGRMSGWVRRGLSCVESS